MLSIRRLITLAAVTAALLMLPAAAQARSALVPSPWPSSSGEPRAAAALRTARPRPPAPPVDGAVIACGALLAVALLGRAGRTVTVRLA